MATLYFAGSVDDDWAELGNWWAAYDAETGAYSSPAAGLPASADDVVLRASCQTNSGSAPTVLTLIAENGETLSISMTATGGFIFDGGAQSTGTLTGDCTFDNYAYNTGTITGDCTFSNGSYNDTPGEITGDCEFSNGSCNTGTITGGCTFDNTSFTNGTITGNCTFSNGSYNDTAGAITGDCEFSSGSENRYLVTGDASFYGDSFSTGFVFGDADFYGTSYSQGGYVTGSMTMYDYSSYTGAGYEVGEPSAATFNDFSSLLGEGVWAFASGDMNDRSYAGGAEVGSMTFNDNSYGEITADAITLWGNPVLVSSVQAVTGPASNNQAIQISFVRRSGINGSSILGVI